MPPKKSNTLTEAELRLMKILWRRGEWPSPTWWRRCPRASTLAYNSVLTTVRHPLKKRAMWSTVRRAARSSTGPCVAEEEASRSEVRHVLRRFWNSREQLLLSLLGDEEIGGRRDGAG